MQCANFFLSVRTACSHSVVLRRERTATDGLPTWLMSQIESGWSLDYITLLPNLHVSVSSCTLSFSVVPFAVLCDHHVSCAPGYVIYRVRLRRGGRKRPVHKGATYGKPVRQGVNELKLNMNHQSVAEGRIGKKCNALRVLNSYWVGQDATYKYFEVIVVDPAHKVRDGDGN